VQGERAVTLSRRRFIGGGAMLMAATMLLPRRGWSFLAEPERTGASGSGPSFDWQDGDPPMLRTLAAALPGFQCTRASEWALLTDATPSDSRGAIALLEATTAQVTRAMGGIGLEARPPAHRHVAILFRRLECYRGFAATHDGFHDSNAAGHYSAHARRSAFAAPTPSRELREAIGVSRRERVDAAHRAAVDEAIDGLRQTMSRLTSHEAAHQVLVERGIHPDPSRCPAWLAEGLACSFETERSIGAFGPDLDVPARRERLERLLAKQAELPLGVLVASPHRPSHGGIQSADWYAQSWGLVAWLHRTRATEFAAYLGSLAHGSALRAAERLESFERSFGPVTALEAPWRAYWRGRGA